MSIEELKLRRFLRKKEEYICCEAKKLEEDKDNGTFFCINCGIVEDDMRIFLPQTAHPINFWRKK